MQIKRVNVIFELQKKRRNISFINWEHDGFRAQNLLLFACNIYIESLLKRIRAKCESVSGGPVQTLSVNIDSDSKHFLV